MMLQGQGEVSLEEPLAVLGMRETRESLAEKQDLDHGFVFHRTPCPSSSGVSKRGRGAALDFGAQGARMRWGVLEEARLMAEQPAAETRETG